MRRPSTFEWRWGRRRWRRFWRSDDDPMPSVPLHRTEPSTARATRPPLSGGGGGSDGDDFGALAANVARSLDPPPEEAAPQDYLARQRGGACNKTRPGPPLPTPPHVQTRGESATRPTRGPHPRRPLRRKPLESATRPTRGPPCAQTRQGPRRAAG